MDKLKVTAALSGQLITGGGYLTFDALLSAAMFGLTQDLDQAHNHLPLKQVDGLYSASSANYGKTGVGKIAIVQSMRPDDLWLDHRWLKKNSKGDVHIKFENVGQNILNTYKTIPGTEMTWYCEGDADKIQRLLDQLPMIGKKRSCLVDKWHIERSVYDGIHGDFDVPMRPVPVDRWDGDKSAPIIDAAWRPAYWNAGHRAACYVS